MTKIIESVRRCKTSRLASQAQRINWLHAEKVTFADYAPCNRPASEGWEKLKGDYWDLEHLCRLVTKEIWYRLSTVGGKHEIYFKPIK